MIVNQLIVLPTKATLEYLSTIMSGSPIEMDLPRTFVEVNASRDLIEPEPEAVYQCRAIGLDVFFDSGRGMSSLILTLESKALWQRFYELQVEAPHWCHSTYHAHITLKEPMPAMPRYIRGFINSIANTLVADTAQPLFFYGEMVKPIEVTAPTDVDYYESRDAVGQQRRNQIGF